MNIIPQLEVPPAPTETHPIIKSIINNNLQKLKKLVKETNIDVLYPCKEVNDYITPLIAAVVNHKVDILTFLLRQGADPNEASSRGLTPLHYVSLSKAPDIFVEKLLKAKADPNGKDLIEWMIDAEPKNRLKVEECWKHPFFRDTDWKIEYLRKIGNREEVKNCRTADKELISSLEKCAGSFKQWKDKFPPELLQKMDGKKKCYPENTLGLLRCIRNLQEHYEVDAAQVDVMEIFPDLFGCVYKFAKTQGWNSETPLKEMFLRENISTSFTSTSPVEPLSVPVQESQPSDLK